MSQPQQLATTKAPAVSRNDYWVLLLVLPYYFILAILLWGYQYVSNWSIFAGTTAIIIVVWPLSWYIHTRAGYLLRTSLPAINQTTVRVLLSLCVFIPITICTNACIIFLCIKFLDYSFTLDQSGKFLLAGVLLNVVATAIFESTYLVTKWKTSLIETEGLKKAYLQSELDNLKSQVNPHFLFNSINSLSTLIMEDPAKAEKFLHEMSKVYRYLLQNNEQELVPLQTELHFIHSYFHLLQTRHESAIFLDVRIPESYHQFLLPPLTLQILIENAVKHNTILENAPLRIDLFIQDNEKLVVQNNLQRKSVSVPSNKIGLQNIKAKYQLLTQQEVLIQESADNFSVTIPIIKHASHEHHDY